MTAAEFDVVVAGGTVVTSRGRRSAHVCIRGGRVVTLAYGSPAPAATVAVDATGLLVLPGMVDSHVHLMDPGDSQREDFPCGTAAAAAAGVTTIVEHTHAWPLTSVDRLREKLAHLHGRSYVDFGLAAHVWPDALDGLEDLWHAGIAFFKIFTCSTHGIPGLDTDALLTTFGTLARLGAPCLVHCEDEMLTSRAEKRLRSAGRDDPGLLMQWRSREAELLAVAQVALLSRLTRTPAVVAHASNAEVLEVIAEERRRGAAVRAESCPQYFHLREEEVNEHGALRKFTPPARIRSLHDENRMWALFNDGVIDQLSSDHAPSTRAQKTGVPFWEAPFGLPGLDTTFPLMIDAALRGRTSWERIVAAYCEQPARQFGLHRKRALAPGADADLVLIDPAARSTVDAAAIRSKAGWSPYEGRELRGGIVATMLRGEIVYRGGVVPEPARGRFVPGPGAIPGSLE